MKELKRIFKNINYRDFRLYLFFSILLVVTLVVFGRFDMTQALYESEAEVDVAPDLAFFIVNVTNTSGHIKLDGIVPRSQPYLFTFQVSNFTATEHADVDLTYSIEVITTTNMQLNFKIYKGNNMTTDVIDSDTLTTDDNGMYYRHLVVDGASTMNFANDVTDTYTLWVEFPTSNMSNPDAYAGIIDLVDIKINAEQVV